jgi:hypothetical protein
MQSLWMDTGEKKIMLLTTIGFLAIDTLMTESFILVKTLEVSHLNSKVSMRLKIGISYCLTMETGIGLQMTTEQDSQTVIT